MPCTENLPPNLQGELVSPKQRMSLVTGLGSALPTLSVRQLTLSDAAQFRRACRPPPSGDGPP